MTQSDYVLDSQLRSDALRVLSAAFVDDPLVAYVFPDAAVRRRRIAGLFGAMYDSDVPLGACLTSPGRQAATIWRKPGFATDTWWATLLQAPAWLAALGPALPRGLAYSQASDANHPAEPHWYLHLAGCDPAHQSRGHGRAAIRAGLDRADRDGVAAYLETATPRNLGYYETMGFQVTHSWRPRGGPETWSMLRRPHLPR